MKILKRIITILGVAMLLTICLSGCDMLKYHNVYGYPGYENLPVKDGFKYWDDGAMYIMGITEEAVDEDGVVEIPKTINGKKVTQLGWWAKNHILSDNGMGGFYFCEGIKEIKLPSTVEEFGEFLSAFHNSTVLLNANFGKKIKLHVYKNSFDMKTVYPIDALNELFMQEHEDVAYFLFDRINGGKRVIANVYFEKNPNDEDEYHYAIDYVKNGEAVRKPKTNPIRDGYEFTGWYKEPECKTLWDFENDIVELNKLEEGYDGVEKYREYLSTVDNYKLSLYAGWRKV